MAITRSLNRGITPSLLQRGLRSPPPSPLPIPIPPSSLLLPSQRLNDYDWSDLKKPCEFLGSWTPSSNPRVAQANLERLRRAYGKQVRQLRKKYAYEVEMLRDKQEKKN